MLPKGLNKLKKFIHVIGNRTRDLPACSIVPQPTTLPPSDINTRRIYFFSKFVLLFSVNIEGGKANHGATCNQVKQT
jgi:hypothetical protein